MTESLDLTIEMADGVKITATNLSLQTLKGAVYEIMAGYAPHSQSDLNVGCASFLSSIDTETTK